MPVFWIVTLRRWVNNLPLATRSIKTAGPLAL
jgi:hypothetical protein